MTGKTALLRSVTMESQGSIHAWRLPSLGRAALRPVGAVWSVVLVASRRRDNRVLGFLGGMLFTALKLRAAVFCLSLALDRLVNVAYLKT